MLLTAVLFTLLLFLRMPIAFAIGISASLYVLLQPTLPLSLTVQRMVTGTQSFPLLAVPFFVLAGHIMNASGITTRLFRFAEALTGHITGSIAQVSIVLSMLMGGISGSSNADAAMETRILLPKMREKGYEDGFSAVVLAFGSLIVAIIPPSIGLILYGFVGQVSIGKLFVAGIVPGLLMGVSMMVTTYLIAKKRGYEAQNLPKRKTFSEIVASIRESFLALLFPLLLVMTIRFGVFTPTEAGAFAVLYATFLGGFVYKELTWTKMRQALQQTVEDNAVILLIVSMAAILGYVIAYGQVPQSLSKLILGISERPGVILTLIMLFLFLAGCFMEGTVNILILTPILLPIVRQAGYDPVHFGILMAILIQIGGVTPPVGVNMFVVCSLGRIPVEKFVKASWPYLLTYLFLLVLLAAFPKLTTFLPDLLM